METAELLKQVRKIEIKTKGLSRQMFAGGYKSSFKGRGMSFSEVREYHYGDDVRNIDWNVTARFDRPHVKVFEEERELTVLLMVDVSRSSFFGTNKELKSGLITLIAATLSLAAIRNNDKVGMLFFSDKVELFIPPKKGKSHALRIIRELIEPQVKGTKTDIAQALRYVNNMLKKRAIVFLLSDFADSNYKEALGIVARRHDVVGLHIYDRHETEMPDIGLVRVQDAESGSVKWVDTSSKETRVKYRAEFLRRTDTLKKNFASTGTDFISLETGKPFIHALMNLFSRRSH